MRIRLGTRGSQLALAQARKMAGRLTAAGHEVIETIVETRGDRDQTSAFPEFGGAGVFVREIERQLLERRIDLAVHSYKDLPSTGPAELVVAAVPERFDPADTLLVRNDVPAGDMAEAEAARSPVPAAEAAPAAPRPAGGALTMGSIPLPQGARVGTSSARRRALLHAARPDLAILPLRGNVDTRVRKLREGSYDAIVLAAAGLERLRIAGADLDLGGIHLHRLDPAWFVPAPTQGALALQIHRDAADLAAALETLHDPAVAVPLEAERVLLQRVEGSCELPFGAWCTADGDGYCLRFVLGDNVRLVTGNERGDHPVALAERAWERLAASEVAP